MNFSLVDGGNIWPGFHRLDSERDETERREKDLEANASMFLGMRELPMFKSFAASSY